jgi:C-terminal processing protease CtpA/Prc
MTGPVSTNVTIARYLTPDNIDINKKGIVPDHNIELKIDDYKAGKGPWWIDPEGPLAKRNPEDGKDVQLNKALEVMAKKIQGATAAPAPFELKLNLSGFEAGSLNPRR